MYCKKILIFILLIQLTGYSYAQTKKYVIGTNIRWGFFASFFNTLEHIIIAKSRNLLPVVYWTKDSPYYCSSGYNGSKNVWEYYFEQVSNAKYQGGDRINFNYVSPHVCHELVAVHHKCSFNSGKCPERYKMKTHIDRHIKIKPTIKQKINEFFEKNIKGKKTVGIHLRGTDKPTEFRSAPAEILIAEANKYRGYQYFVATDEEALLEKAKKLLNGRVIYYDAYRSKNGQPVHYSNNNPAKAGEDILIESQLLAKCDKFIHTSSNVSMAVLCFNPDLDNTVFPPIFRKGFSINDISLLLLASD